MGRHLELSHLTEEECERILQVIQRDFDLRQKEKSRLNIIEEEIKEEDTKVAVLSKKKDFNDNCCMRCFARFYFIFNQKLQCMRCEYYICKNCSSYDNKVKKYVCNVCCKQKDLQNQSFDWFYSNMKTRFKRFGSAKVVRSLYKRKTDSDSENDSGYDPSQYSNSLPVSSKRSRQTIEGFFSHLMSKPLNSSDTSSIGIGQGAYEAVREKEVEKFRHEINHIVNDVHRTLDNQTPESPHSTDILTKYGHLLDTHRLHICTALSNLSQSLHTALDNQQLQNSTESTSKSTQHASVQQTIYKEVENYVGHPISLRGDDTASLASSQSLTKDHEETLADAIIQKLLNDRKVSDERHHEREEAKVRRDLTKLSNQCTITQLQDLMTDTDTEDNMTHNSSMYIETDNESHLSEQQEFQLDKITASTAMSTSTPRYETNHAQNASIYDSGQTDDSDIDLDELVANNSMNAKLKNKVFCPRLSSTASVDSSQRTLDPMSVSSAEDVDVTSITVTSPEGDVFSVSDQSNNNNKKIPNGRAGIVDEDLQEMKANSLSSRPVAIKRREAGSDAESDVTIEAESGDDTPYGSPVTEPIIRKSQVVKEYTEPRFHDEDDEEEEEEGYVTYSEHIDGSYKGPSDSLYVSSQQRKIPLPSFDDSNSNLGIEEVDLDDISRHGDESEDNISTMESEILFCRSWEVTQPGPLFKDRISAYDNFGERKVGRDDSAPVFMLVPNLGEDLTPKVGGQDVSELSDLSENDDSESESDSDEDDEEKAARSARRRRRKSKDALKKVSTDFAAQTDGIKGEEVVESVGVMAEANVEQEYITVLPAPVTELSQKEKLELLRQKQLEEEDPEEEADPEDADPRFVERPQTMTSPVGEPVKFTCQVIGTTPLDVFWYKEEDEVKQLEDDEHYEIKTHNDRHILEIFNTNQEHRGQYFCIAVNEKGRNHKTFKLRLTENKSEKAAPEFLKSPVDIEMMEGMNATFRCKVKGYPQPRVTWYKDGKPLHNSERYTLKKLGNRDYTLRIDSVTMDDDAEYAVVARNMMGEARTTTQLMIETKSDETERKYADLEEKSLAEPRDLKRDLPRTDELLKIAEEVHNSRTQVTNTAENILHSANKYHFDDYDLERSVIDDDVTPISWNALLLSSIHNQIDEMDKKLNNLQDEVHQTMLTRSDSLTSEDDSFNNNSRYSSSYSPPVVTNSLRQSILREHDDMRNMAGAVRRVTSTALEVLSTSDTLMKATKDLPSEQYQGEQDEGDDEVFQKKAEEFVIDKDNEVDDQQEEELHLSYADFEVLYKHGKISKEQLKSGRIGRREGESILQTLQELRKHSIEEELVKDNSLSVEGMPTSIDCGLKRIPSKRYKRDFVINRSPTPQRKKWEVNQSSPSGTGDIVRGSLTGVHPDDINEMEESVYMTAGGVYSLEKRIKRLQSAVSKDDLTEADMGTLEDEVARTAAQVTQSEKQVSKIEKQVSNLQEQQMHSTPQSSFSLQSEPSDLISLGSSSTPTKPSSPFSTESPQYLTDEDEGIELPSVKNLRSLFNKKTEDGQSVRRVHSLTGRDLPRGVREKLAGHSVVPSSNVRIQPERVHDPVRNDSKRRNPLPETFHTPHTLQAVPIQEEQLTSASSMEPEVKKQETASPAETLPSTSTPKAMSTAAMGGHNDSSSRRSIAATSRSTSASSPTIVLSSSSLHTPSPNASPVSASSDLSLSSTTHENSASGGQNVIRRSLSSSSASSAGGSSVAPKKNRRSAIMARAAFWDQRILEGKASDREVGEEEFPIFPGQNFKNSGDQ